MALCAMQAPRFARCAERSTTSRVHSVISSSSRSGRASAGVLRRQVGGQDDRAFSPAISVCCEHYTWFRRAQNHGRTFLDDYVATNALGTCFIAAVSIAISITNTSWTVSDRYIENYRRLGEEADVSNLFLDFLPFRADDVELQSSIVMALLFQSASFLSFIGILRAADYSADADSGKCAVNLKGLGFLKAWTGGRTASCHIVTNARLPLQKEMVAWWAGIGYWAASINSVQMLLLIILYLSERILAVLPVSGGYWTRVTRFFKAAVSWQRSMNGFSAYMAFSWSLIIMSIWDLTDYNEWEQWMWKDPWSEQLWIF